jgi:hypothetical protein
MTLVGMERAVQLACLSDPHTIETLDMDRLVEDLTDGMPPSFLTPERICVQDLIVVATEARSGRYLGLLGARDDSAGGQAFLRLDMACVAPRARGQRLIARLLARAAMERVGRVTALVARTATPAWFHALSHFASDLAGSAFHPAPAGVVVALRTVALARQIASALSPEHRYDVASGVLHGKLTMPAMSLQRHASAEAWCEAMRDAPPVLSERLLAVVDLRDVTAATLQARAGHVASSG